jgi:hypothetical protein
MNFISSIQEKFNLNFTDEDNQYKIKLMKLHASLDSSNKLDAVHEYTNNPVAGIVMGEKESPDGIKISGMTRQKPDINADKDKTVNLNFKYKTKYSGGKIKLIV